MAIPESQLETWSHIGAGKGSASTYKTVKDALGDSGAPYAGHSYSVFLQGSYGNDTNIYSESDVDVVICLDDCFQSDRTELPAEQKAAWKAAHPNSATYTLVEFKRDVLKVLAGRFGKDVKEGKKALMIAASGNRRKADVIVATQFRRYSKFNSVSDQEYAKGICFFTSAGERIANYPRLHRENLTSSHQDSGEWLKPMIRVMKNLRSKLVEDGKIEAGVAPSYFVEGLLYNLPCEKFAKDYQTCLFNVLKWFQDTEEAEKTGLVCANEQYYLLRDGVPTCWPREDCEAFMAAAIELWNNWNARIWI